MFLGDDITEQVMARKKIEESENRFRSMANEAPIFVWLTNEKLQTTFLNKTGLIYFGLKENTDLSTLSWKKFIHPEDIGRVLTVMNNASDNHVSYSLEMRLRNEVGGEYRWFMDKGVPRYENNNFIGFVGTSLDIHDQKIKEEAKDEFISIAGHELKTPLTSAKAYIQMAQNVLRNDADSGLLFVEKANKSIEKLNILITGITGHKQDPKWKTSTQYEHF
jgi:PAS domain S-box-containing protein